MKNLKELEHLAERRQDPSLFNISRWLKQVSALLGKVNSGSVESAVAFGTAFEKLDNGLPRKRARWGSEHYVEVLIVTPREDAFALEDELAEKVFGPMFADSGHLTRYHVWPRQRIYVERQAKSRFWRDLERQAVLLAGEPLR